MTGSRTDNGCHLRGKWGGREIRERRPGEPSVVLSGQGSHPVCCASAGRVVSCGNDKLMPHTDRTPSPSQENCDLDAEGVGENVTRKVCPRRAVRPLSSDQAAELTWPVLPVFQFSTSSHTAPTQCDHTTLRRPGIDRPHPCGDSGTILLDFASAAAEFALNRAVDWPFHTRQTDCRPARAPVLDSGLRSGDCPRQRGGCRPGVTDAARDPIRGDCPGFPDFATYRTHSWIAFVCALHTSASELNVVPSVAGPDEQDSSRGPACVSCGKVVGSRWRGIC